MLHAYGVNEWVGTAVHNRHSGPSRRKTKVTRSDGLVRLKPSSRVHEPHTFTEAVPWAADGLDSPGSAKFRQQGWRRTPTLPPA